jgi:hypothetical protein
MENCGSEVWPAICQTNYRISPLRQKLIAICIFGVFF